MSLILKLVSRERKENIRNGIPLILGIPIIALFSVLFDNYVFAEQKICQTLTFSYFNDKTNLEIIETEPYKHQVKLNGRIIHNDEGNFTLTIISFLPTWGMYGENIILLSENRGGSGTGATYRLIAVRPKGATYTSESFGNGTIPTIIDDSHPSKSRIAFKFPQMRQKTQLTWIYDNGKVRKGE